MDLSLYPGTLTDVPGLRVGHFADEQAGTGLTVVLAPGALAAVDVRGGAPGTMETDALQPTATNSAIHAIVLAGRSLFGLQSVFGVMRYLAEENIGLKRQGIVIPIVPAAVIYDWNGFYHDVRPSEEWGYLAAKEASAGVVVQGNVGVGIGARMGKWLGGLPLKSGVGSASITLQGHYGPVVVSALVVVNALGDAVDPYSGLLYCRGGFDPLVLAKMGTFTPERGYLRPGVFDVAHPHRLLDQSLSSLKSVASEERLADQSADPGLNTTLAIVATNALLSKSQLAKIAQMSHDGFARAIRPVHSTADGDVAFTLSVGGESRIPFAADPFLTVDVLGSAAADMITAAIANAVLSADSRDGWLGYNDWLIWRKENESGPLV